MTEAVYGFVFMRILSEIVQRCDLMISQGLLQSSQDIRKNSSVLHKVLWELV